MTEETEEDLSNRLDTAENQLFRLLEAKYSIWNAVDELRIPRSSDIEVMQSAIEKEISGLEQKIKIIQSQ